MRPLDDNQQLVLAELVHLFVGPTDVRDDRELLAILLEQDRIVRRDQAGRRFETSIAQGFSRIRRLISSSSVSS